MHSSENEEHVGSIHLNSQIYQMTSTIIGLLTKRSTKVEPHPIVENIEQVSNLTRPSSACSHNSSSSHNISFAKCTEWTSSKAKSSSITIETSNLKIKPLPPTAIDVCVKKQLDLSSNGETNLVKSNQINHKKNKTFAHYSNIDGSQSDGGEVVLRKFHKHRSPNHNRFSHQFSLCCKAEKRPLTPPITVRYNSITEAANHSLHRSDSSLKRSVKDNTPPLNSENLNSCTNHSSAVQISNAKLTISTSAPVSPITIKTQQNSHSSPSSVKSDAINCPIRPIAVSECKSRLRLKLYPPEKSLQTSFNTLKDKEKNPPDHMLSQSIAESFEIQTEKKLQEKSLSSECKKVDQQSSSGLARQALMAAQVLSLMPTEKARERSILDGRLGFSCLLGPSELNRILPDKEVTIFVGTWNMNGQNPPKQMNDFVLPATVDHIPDIVAIGTQESSPDRFEWEVSLQETLGPSHVLFHSTTLGTLHLAVYMRRDLIWYCSAPEDANMSVRTGSAFRTKGAVAISFCLFGTSMLFVTSHLTAHQQKVKERVSDVKRITHALDLPKNLNLRHKNKDVTQNFDNVFWCGDLNFRLSEPREKLLEWIQNTKFPLPSHLPHGYMHTDQLSSVLSDGAAFRGFMEANITFPPTYKYDPGTQHFDTSSKQRAPAYTDRILYKYRQTQGLVSRRQSTVQSAPISTQPYVQCMLYDSVPSIITSDHKPVWALFKTVIRAGADSIPLAAGLFSRDIYLEGMKRRLNNQYSGSSAVCVIQ